MPIMLGRSRAMMKKFYMALMVLVLGALGSSASALSGAWDLCDISVTPPAGPVPHTVTLSGTVYRSISSGFVEAYSSINWGDGFFSGPITGSIWINPTHVRWYANHTYTTTGTYTITNNVVYAIDPMFTWIDRNASAFCSSNNVAVGTKAPINTGRVMPICGNGIVEAPEQCDAGVNNGQPASGCSATCTLVMPKCAITVTPSTGTAPLSVVATVTGSVPSINSVSWGDSTSTFGPWLGTAVTGTWFSTPHTYMTSGTYTISATATNPYSPNYSTMCSATVVVMGKITPKPICGNGVVEAPEQCDLGASNGVPGSGCSLTCQYTIPTCNLTVAPTSGLAPLSVTFTLTGFGGVIGSIYWGEGPIAFGPWLGTGVPPTFTSGHTYMTAGVYGITITYVNPLVPNLMTRCNASIYATGKPVVTTTGTTTTGVVINPVFTGRVNTGVVINPVFTGRINTGVVINPVLTGKVITPVLTGRVVITTTGIIINPVLTGKVITPVLTGRVITPVLTGRVLPPVLTSGIIIRSPTSTVLSPMPFATGTTSMDVVNTLIGWAYRYGITPVKLSATQIYAPVSRYGVAQMFVQFAKNVKKQEIAHTALCDITKYNDYTTFTPGMQITIMQACDLGLMGLTANGKSLISSFNPSALLTSDQLVTIINRYKPGMIASGAKLQNRNIDVLFQLLNIASAQ